jgi:hypothetical protein
MVMGNMSISDKIELIKTKSKVAKDIRDKYGNADLSDLIRNYNRAVSEFDLPPSTTGSAILKDPLDLKDFDGDLGTIDIKGISAPDVSEDVDRTINPENLISAANLYACYQFEKLGVFKVVESIFADFFHGKLRISSETGALSLYRYEKRKKERYSKEKRNHVYKRNFNYGTTKSPDNAHVNKDFNKLLLNFVKSVSVFYRDQRISEVIRKGASGLESSFGSIEMVRKSGIELRNAINRYATGITLLFTIELSTYLDECLQLLRLPEIHKAYNVKSEWQLIEKISEQRFKGNEKASVRGSLAQEGKRMLEWLAGDDVLAEDSIVFEIVLNQIGQSAERWIMSYKSLSSS